MALSQLLRLPNLFVLALTQGLIYWYVFRQAFLQKGILPVLSTENLLILLLATSCVAAAGYIINDLVDYRIDQVNRSSERIIVGHQINEGTVRWLYFVFVFGGFLLSLLLAFALDEIEWLWLYPASCALLAAYPIALKRSPWIGNIVISLFCAGAPALIWLAERASWQALGEAAAESQARVTMIIVLFIVFAFLATWIRELVKDLEDQQGDQLFGRRTMPVVQGVEATKRKVYVLMGLLFLALVTPLFLRWPGFLDLSVFIVLIALMGWLVVMWRKLRRAQQKKAFSELSLQLKFYLLGGLLLLMIYQI